MTAPADLATARREAELFLSAGHEWDGPTCIRALEIITALLAASTEPAPALPEEVREAAELLREVYDETDCGCDTATCRDTCLSAKVRAWLAALAARPAVAASDEVREEVLGTCELCRASRRRVHRELPNRFVECHGAGFVWLCKRCGRWNTAINNGKAICCTDPCERGGE